MKNFECDKCHGTGKVHWKHIQNGVCFKCKGDGRLNYNPRPACAVEIDLYAKHGDPEQMIEAYKIQSWNTFSHEVLR